MGMFDYIKCEMPIPETDVVPRAGRLLDGREWNDMPGAQHA